MSYTSYYKMKAINKLVRELYAVFKGTVCSHKKKIIALAIMFVGVVAIRKFVKPSHIISLTVFCIKFWSNTLSLLPMPRFAAYRQTNSFEYVSEVPIPEITWVINLPMILAKVKARQPNSFQLLKEVVLSGTVLAIVMYNAQSFYDLVFSKYHYDFAQLGAYAEFDRTIKKLKDNFKSNLSNAREIIHSRLYGFIESLDPAEFFDCNQLKQLYSRMISNLYQETEQQKNLWNRSLAVNQSHCFREADNYFRTTRKYEVPHPNQHAPVRKMAAILATPFSLLYKGVSSILSTPEEQVTQYSFFCSQFLYQLPLKKYRDEEEWPNAESKYLSELVIEEISQFFSSLNFSTLSQKRAEYNLLVFCNRIKMFFSKKSIAPKKLLQLLPVCFKIMKQELLEAKNKENLYEREILLSIKQTQMLHEPCKTSIEEVSLRNDILLEIYKQNQLKYLEKDIYAKYFNERDGLIIRPHSRTSSRRQFAQEEQPTEADMQQFMKAYQEVNNEGFTRQMISKLKGTIAPE